MTSLKRSLGSKTNQDFIVSNIPTKFHVTRFIIVFSINRSICGVVNIYLSYDKTFDRLSVCALCFHSELQNVLIACHLVNSSNLWLTVIISTC